MAINVQYADPLAIAQASMQIGQGQFAQDREQQAMRERAMRLQEAGFAEEQAQNDFRNQFAQQQFGADQYNRDRALRYGAYQDAQQMGLRQQALQQDAMGRQQQVGLQQAEMAARDRQQQMLMSREQAQMLHQAQRQQYDAHMRKGLADWEALQKARTDGRTFISPAHYQAAVDKWQETYSGFESAPFSLPMGEEPAVPPKLQGFYEEYGVPYDEQTGEPLVPPAVMGQIITAKTSARRDEMKAQIDAQKLAIEEQKAQQEMERTALDQGFQQSNEQQNAAQQELKKRETEDTKFVMGLISNYEGAMPEERGAKPKIPDGARLSSTVAEYLRDSGYLTRGMRVYIDGNYIEVQ